MDNQCPKCGAVIKSGDICEYCGARLLHEEPVQEEIKDDPNAPVYVTEPDHEAIRKRRIRTVIIAVVLFWAILWLIVMFGSMKKRHINVDVSVKVNNQAEETPAGDPKDYMTEKNRVFQYYEATVGTPDGNDAEQYDLYKYGSKMILSMKTSAYGDDEWSDYRIVSSDVWDDCMRVVKRERMRKWRSGKGLRGKEYRITFADGLETVMVSSDDMPDDGREAFEEIAEILMKGWQEGEKEK